MAQILFEILSLIILYALAYRWDHATCRYANAYKLNKNNQVAFNFLFLILQRLNNVNSYSVHKQP